MVVFPRARNITHIAPAYPAVMGTRQCCHLLGKGKAGPACTIATHFVANSACAYVCVGVPGTSHIATP